MRSKTVILSLALVALGATTVMGQRAASTKEMGTAYDMWSSGVYFNQALDHSRVLQNYSTYNQPVPQGIVQRHAEAIRSSLDAAKKSYSGLAEKHPDDETVKSHLATLDEHHGNATAALDKLDAAAASGDAKPQAVKKQSANAIRSLCGAKMTHNKLMEHLGVENPAAKGKGKKKAQPTTDDAD